MTTGFSIKACAIAYAAILQERTYDHSLRIQPTNGPLLVQSSIKHPRVNAVPK